MADIATVDELPVDERVRVPLNGKVVDLAALDQATGGHGLSASDTEVVAVDGSPVTEKQLVTAVGAAVEVVPPPTRDEVIDALPNPTVDFAGFREALRTLLTT